MLRNRWLWLTCLFLILPFSAQAQPVVGPLVQWITPTSATIVWETAEPAVGSVEFGENELVNAVSGFEPVTVHRLVIQNLKPETRYAYRCRWKDQVTETFSFRTAPPAGTRTTRMAVIGGTDRSPETTRKLVRMISEEHPELLIHTGDLVPPDARQMDWETLFFSPFQGLSHGLPIYPVVSPNTVESDSFSTYFAASNGDGYWKLEYSDVLLIGLNTARPSDPGSEQYVWLRSVLNQNRLPWVVVVMNQPMFSIAPNTPPRDIRWNWQPLFQEFGIDLVISGGEPFYHRTHPIGYLRGFPQRGIRHLTVGGGNSVIPPRKPDYSQRRHNTPQYVILEFEDDRMFVRAIDSNSIPIDAFVVMKQAGNSPSEFVSFEMMELERDLSNPENWSRNQGNPETGMVELRPQIDINTEFTFPVRGEAEWVSVGSWNPNKKEIIQIQPAELLELDFSVYTSSNVFPLPQLQLRLDYDNSTNDVMAPLRGFKNNVIQVSPLRIQKDVEIEIQRSSRSIVSDREIAGNLERPSIPYTDFFVDETGARPSDETSLQFYFDDTHLYVNAKILTPAFYPVSKASYITGNDRDGLRENDHARLLIATNDNIYEFLLCSNGERLDSRNGDTSWTAGWLSRTNTGQESDWELEMAIPFDVFGGRDQIFLLEFVRYNRFAMESSVLRPSYEAAITDPSYFASVSFSE